MYTLCACGEFWCQIVTFCMWPWHRTALCVAGRDPCCNSCCCEGEGTRVTVAVSTAIGQRDNRFWVWFSNPSEKKQLQERIEMSKLRFVEDVLFPCHAAAVVRKFAVVNDWETLPVSFCAPRACRTHLKVAIN